jgi:2-methylcitrate dehydratase PrpD
MNISTALGGLPPVNDRAECHQRHDRVHLSRDLMCSEMLYKYWRLVGTAFSHIHALVELLKDHPPRSEDIREGRAYVGDSTSACARAEHSVRAGLLIDSKLSLPFLLALTLIKAAHGWADVSTGSLRNPEIVAMAHKVTPISDAAFSWTAELPAAKVEMETTDGRVLFRLGTELPESPERPMTCDQLAAFTDCALVARRR